MKIFICGKLGEIVKKVLEFELLIKDNPSNVLLVAEHAAYQHVLSMWPVLNKKELEQSIDIFKFNISNLREKEACLREAQSVAMYDFLAKNKYLAALDAVRENMAYINHLGEHIGPSPLLEVEDANDLAVH